MRDDALIKFLNGDPKLWTLYLSFRDASGANADPACADFVAWLIVKGRWAYQTAFSISSSLVEELRTAEVGGRHALMSYLDGQSEEKHTDLASWFYEAAIYEWRLAPFLSAEDLRRVVDLPPRNPPNGTNRDSPHDWARARLLRAFQARQRELWPKRPRVAIVGFHRSMLGLGEDARSLMECLCDIGVIPEMVDVSPSFLSEAGEAELYAPFEAPRPSAPIVIFCLPPFETMRAIVRLNLSRPPGSSYWIGYWPWETSRLPDNWMFVFDAVDEIWAPSTFLKGVYANVTHKPVQFVSPHVAISEPASSRQFHPLFGDSFTFLSIFDFNSHIARKNPMGSINAFRAAFPRHIRDVRLILKTINGESCAEDLSSIVQEIADDDRIIVLDGSIPKPEVCGLIAAADVLLSLHRAEGFGRPLVEAMMLGTAVVATSWSGPSDFLDANTGFPIRSSLRPVRPGEYPQATGLWAEPDIDQAASIMRGLYENGEVPAEIITRARQKAQSKFGRTGVAKLLRERLALS
jgi:glycosyltransferase involved in cell wall biosynthesis